MPVQRATISRNFFLGHRVPQQASNPFPARAICSSSASCFCRLGQSRRTAAQPALFSIRRCCSASSISRAWLLDLLAQLLHAADGVLFVLPLGLHRVERLALLGQLLLQFVQAAALDSSSSSFLRAASSICSCMISRLMSSSSLRHGVHLRADHGAGLVHQVDGLVRQETVGDVAVGKAWPRQSAPRSVIFTPWNTS